MISSRIALSLSAMAFSGMVKLAWDSASGFGIALAEGDRWVVQSIVLLGICAACAVFWWLTFFRDPDYHYLLSSRLLLSVLSGVFGVFAATSLVHFDILQLVNFHTLSTMAFAAYACGAAGFVLIWFTVYFKTRGFVRGSQTSRATGQQV